ncbi:MAG: hypothetical protein HYS18_11195 [Burkholderiales bacterium]|nr:hypothetical protein [Burkholderiales bacterium]
MPYVIKSKYGLSALNIPTTCAYCSDHKTDDSIELTYAKNQMVIPIPGLLLFFSYDLYRYRFPACHQCARLFRVIGALGPVAIVLPWILFLLTIFLSWTHGERILIAAQVSSALGVIALFYKQWKFRAFRVGHEGDRETLFFCRSQRYAEDFSALNDLSYEYKFFVFKVR